MSEATYPPTGDSGIGYVRHLKCSARWVICLLSATPGTQSTSGRGLCQSMDEGYFLYFPSNGAHEDLSAYVTGAAPWALAPKTTRAIRETLSFFPDCLAWELVPGLGPELHACVGQWLVLLASCHKSGFHIERPKKKRSKKWNVHERRLIKLFSIGPTWAIHEN